jgi:GNAT superfamily N-acetyltransferase
MKEVYTAAYSHFWTDKGAWYLNSQYSEDTVIKELSEENAVYYFIVFNKEVVGTFRFVWDEKLKGISEEKQVKLHRIYLHPKTQGKGVGKKLLSWLEKKAQKKGYQIIWLDAMDKQVDAFEFYKKRGYLYHTHLFLPFDLMHKEVRKMSQIYKKL